MPSGTKVDQYFLDIKEGKSTIARAFDDLFGTDDAITTWTGKGLAGHTLQDLNPQQYPNLPDWARAELKGVDAAGKPYLSELVADGHHLNDNDIAHIDSWDPADKDKIWETVRDAMQASRRVQFFWDLLKGSKSDVDIQIPGDNTPITITFITPRSKVTFNAETNEVDIQV